MADLVVKLLSAAIDLGLLIGAEREQLLEGLPDHALDIDPLRRGWVVQIAFQLEEEVLRLGGHRYGLRAASVVVEYVLLAIGWHGSIQTLLDWTWTQRCGPWLAGEAIVHGGLADSVY